MDKIKQRTHLEKNSSVYCAIDSFCTEFGAFLLDFSNIASLSKMPFFHIPATKMAIIMTLR